MTNNPRIYVEDEIRDDATIPEIIQYLKYMRERVNEIRRGDNDRFLRNGAAAITVGRVNADEASLGDVVADNIDLTGDLTADNVSANNMTAGIMGVRDRDGNPGAQIGRTGSVASSNTLYLNSATSNYVHAPSGASIDLNFGTLLNRQSALRARGTVDEGGTMTSGEVFPGVTDLIDLGTDSYKWKSVKAKDMTADGTVQADILKARALDLTEPITPVLPDGLAYATPTTTLSGGSSKTINIPENFDGLLVVMPRSATSTNLGYYAGVYAITRGTGSAYVAVVKSATRITTTGGSGTVSVSSTSGSSSVYFSVIGNAKATIS